MSQLKTLRHHSSPALIAAGLALLFALMLMSVGCTSIYHRTRAEMPPDPGAEAALRLADARQAEAQASQAGQKLLANLRRGKTDTLLSADFDRLEAAGFELERRTLTARDANARHGDLAAGIAELERLHQRAQSWLTYVSANRLADRATQIAQLEALLASPSEVDRRTR